MFNIFTKRIIIPVFLKPLIITLMFYKPVGFDKIYYPVILQNHIGWDK